MTIDETRLGSEVRVRLFTDVGRGSWGRPLIRAGWRSERQ